MHATLLILANVCAIESFATQHADLAFGHAQVAQFMLDRPGTAQIITARTELRHFLESNFAGVETGQRVAWDHAEPVTGAPSECNGRWHEYPAIIHVSNSPSYSAIDKCTYLVYEIHNIRSTNRFNSLTYMVYSKKITRHDYAFGMARIEFESGTNTRDFFRQHPLVATDVRLSRDENKLYQDLLSYPDDFSDYLRSPIVGFHGSTLIKYYGDAYDGMVGASKHATATLSHSPNSEVVEWNKIIGLLEPMPVFNIPEKENKDFYNDILLRPSKD